jgi:hypothetical protein
VGWEALEYRRARRCERCGVAHNDDVARIAALVATIGAYCLAMGDDQPLHPAVARVVRDHDATAVLDLLCHELSGSDHTALMLEVVRRRAAGVAARDVLAQFERDRFVRPAQVDALRLLRIELEVLESVSSVFEPIAGSPLVPFGTHSVIAGVHQDRVVTTVRGSEVAADPTNSLALEAAVRRRRLSNNERCDSVVRLSTVERVVRAQRFSGPLSFAHFSLLGLVSAGCDTGNQSFETDEVVNHLRAHIDALGAVPCTAVTIRLTDFGGQHRVVLEQVAEQLEASAVHVELWDERPDARNYYPSICFKLAVDIAGESVEVGDGGLVDWTQVLVSSAKERLMISGLSLERLLASHPEPLT